MLDPERTGVARTLVVALLGLGALAAAVAFGLRLSQPAGTSPPHAAASAVVAPPPPAAPPVAAPPANPDAPTFDIVRISPRGDAVLAGHAAPGAMVAIQDGGREIGRAVADDAGNWVFVPTAPLPSGAQELTLSETLPDGSFVKGAASVVMAVPAPGGTPALAVLDQPGAAPRVLQAPPGGQDATLAFGAVDYDDRGQPRFAGNAPAGAPLRVFVDNRAVGDSVADAQGRWTLSPAATIAPGQHRLRVDQLDRHGHVTARAEVPFLREQLTAEQLGGNRVVVQPGESLWRLARLTYGNGMRYTVIYQANQAQISDPRKIFPGQALTVPPDASAKPNP